MPMPGTPKVTASIAAATVPEYRTSSPMLGPWLTPENTKSGRSGMSACSASMTQSVGVPSICQAPSGRRVGRSGRCKVSECEVPLCSRSGATTVTVPTFRHASASKAIPGASMPSSLLTRMFIYSFFRWSLPVQNPDGLLDGAADFLGQFRLERAMSRYPELAGPAIVVDPLSGAVDGELFSVQQMLHQHDQLYLPPLVHSV